MESTNGSAEEDVGGTPGAPAPPALGQSLADQDQTLADTEQSGSDSDQTAADGDQAAADSDQAASDRDLAEGSDPAVHGYSRDLREQSAVRRRESAGARIDAAAARDAVARARDQAAAARDEVAALHDRELDARDAAWAGDQRHNIVVRAAENRKRAAADRVAAAEGRARAAEDREQATRDREQAARDRVEAQADREALLHQLAVSETDPLTGARTRAPGLADVDREIARSRRTTGLLAITYVDVVGLKAVNDLRGHAAGDALLQRVVRAIRSHLRPYDSIVRLGGDEFLCVMSLTTVDDARRRFDAIQSGLAADSEPAQIKVGFSALEPDDVTADLVERADTDMLASRPR
ncbi:MAG TPA: GGDEF domain-containing protein [Thermoleophilaceae bacterium]|nr:GGDEF domain-containing protein [Thermoleophilaceae bacterium]